MDDQLEKLLKYLVIDRRPGDYSEKLKEIFTYETWMHIVKQNTIHFEFVPNNLKTKELCEIAVKQNELATLSWSNHFDLSSFEDRFRRKHSYSNKRFWN